jgi:predicted enzyme related to lactoylglutathione lyase
MGEPGWSIGTFAWRELATDDVDGARRFHRELLGWTWHPEGPPGGACTYWLASRGEVRVGGVSAKPPGSSIPTAWSSWVLVEDVTAAAERCREAGGQVRYGPDEIPGVGRFAVLADPWSAADPDGAALGLLQRR